MGFNKAGSKASSSVSWVKDRSEAQRPANERPPESSWRSSARPVCRSPSPAPSSTRKSSSSCKSTTSTTSTTTSISTVDIRPTVDELLNERRDISPYRGTNSAKAQLTERYKVDEFKFRYWLVTEGMSLGVRDEVRDCSLGKTKDGGWLGHEGHQNIKIGVLKYIVSQMSRAGIVPPQDKIALLERVIKSRKSAASRFFADSSLITPESVPEYDGHKHHFKELEALLEQLKQIKSARPKLDVAQIRQKGSWR